MVYSIDTKVLPNEYYSRFNIDTNREVFYSHISFSNEGNVTIDKDDILEGIEIICLGKIYDIDEASNIKEVALNSLYHVDFKYLEPYDFISLRVIHTDKVDVRVKIKDGYIEKEKD